MKGKKIICSALIVIGVGLIAYGFYGKQKMTRARGDINTATGFLPESPVTEIVKDRLHGEVDKYKLPVIFLFVGGVLFIVVGAGALCCRSKKKK